MRPRHRAGMPAAALAVLAAGVLAAACSTGTGSAAPTTVQPVAPAPTTPVPTTAVPTTAVPTTAAPAPTVLPTRAEAADAGALAARLVAAERTVRDRAADPGAVAAAGVDQQLLYRQWVGRPEWDDAVRSLLPADLLVPVGRNLEARRVVVEAARRRARPLPPTVPAWEIVPPRPPEELLRAYRDAEAATGVPWPYLAAINLVETRMGRIVGASSAGAIGPMQFLPTTWASCCSGDPWDPYDAVQGAARYLVQRGAPDDMQRALYGYNPSESYVAAVTLYAQNMIDDERAYLGYHAWQVIVGTSAGDVRLPEGFRATEPVDAAAYLFAHPHDAA